MTSFMNHKTMVPAHEQGILDFAPGAAAAFSLRNLSYSYNGPVVTVRRSTDNAERDFTSTEVSDGTLAAWCGGGDGFVKTWHDQSQHGRDATQTTTTYQPKIVASGVLVTEGGKAAVQFDGNDVLITSSSFATKTSASAFIVAAAASWTTPNSYRTPLCHAYAGATNSGVGFLFVISSASQDWLAGDAVSFGSGFLQAQHPRSIGPLQSGADIRAASIFIGPADASTYINGASLPSRVSVAGSILLATGPVSIGATANAQDAWLGTISEVIYYQSIQTPVRSRITANQMWYF